MRRFLQRPRHVLDCLLVFFFYSVSLCAPFESPCTHFCHPLFFRHVVSFCLLTFTFFFSPLFASLTMENWWALAHFSNYGYGHFNVVCNEEVSLFFTIILTNATTENTKPNFVKKKSIFCCIRSNKLIFGNEKNFFVIWKTDFDASLWEN